MAKRRAKDFGMLILGAGIAQTVAYSNPIPPDVSLDFGLVFMAVGFVISVAAGDFD